MALIRGLIRLFPVLMVCAYVQAQTLQVVSESDQSGSAASSNVKSLKLKELVPIQVSATYDLVQISTDQQLAIYRDLLKHIDDPEMEAVVMARVADLEVMLQDQLSAYSEEQEDGSYFSDFSLAINMYRQRLEKYPNRFDNDSLLYQMAKAYDISGPGALSLDALTQLV